ncbi:MAG: gamma-glutamylcyclotransferase family protein [Planctomycetota bacterium]
MHLFAYGTLMFPEVWRCVTGSRFEAVPATLRGYRIRCVRNDLYPVIFPNADLSESSKVTGLVYLDVDSACFERLDAYESSVYDRVEVAVDLQQGDVLKCQAYVLARRHRDLASDETWDAGWFLKHALSEYMRRLR